MYITYLRWRQFLISFVLHFTERPHGNTPSSLLVLSFDWITSTVHRRRLGTSIHTVLSTHHTDGGDQKTKVRILLLPLSLLWIISTRSRRECLAISDLCKYRCRQCAFTVVDHHLWVIEQCVGCCVVYDLRLSPSSAEYLFVRPAADCTGQIDDTALGSQKRKVDAVDPTIKGKGKKKPNTNRREYSLISSP